MPLGWEHRKRLARLTGLLVDLAAAAAPAPAGHEGLAALVDAVEEQVRSAFSPDGELADEFARLFGPARGMSPALRAAALGGWLKEVLAADAREAQAAEAFRLPPPEASRKVSLGFKLRSPLTRDDDAARSAAGERPGEAGERSAGSEPAGP
jgi:hypothetical protein